MMHSCHNINKYFCDIPPTQADIITIPVTQFPCLLSRTPLTTAEAMFTCLYCTLLSAANAVTMADLFSHSKFKGAIPYKWY